MTPEQSLRVLSRIWGGSRDGWVFLPWIDGDAKDSADRRGKYHEGKQFAWPKGRKAILEHMEKHVDDDLYFCPNIFDEPRRVSQYAREERAIWADLDEVDPRTIDHDIHPTIAWETSPGRYQAVWVLTADALLASEAGGLGQRMTYLIGADRSGWDVTQLLRPPGWRNHKPEYRELYGKPPQGKLIWQARARYDPMDLHEILPRVQTSLAKSEQALEQDIQAISVHKVMGRVRLKLPREAKDLIRAKDTHGADRSQKLFYIEQCLAEAGCTLSEIVAIVRSTVWNKYTDRNDELKRLSIEADKAIVKTRKAESKDTDDDSEDSVFEVLESAEDLGDAELIGTLIANAPQPRWLVQDIWNEGSCGLIAGAPKSFKSYIALDLAISIATGKKFLDTYRIKNQGPVLLIQEEDALPNLRKRIGEVTSTKCPEYHPEGHIKLAKRGKGVLWGPPKPLNIYAKVRAGIRLDDPMYQEWLDDQLSKRDYRMLIIDPMIMVMGDIDENRYGEMTNNFLTPLKQLAEKYGVAIALVHHTRKSPHTGRRGAALLGSQASHGWADDWLHLDKSDDGLANVEVMRESKSAETLKFEMIPKVRRSGWYPEMGPDITSIDKSASQNGRKRQRSNGQGSLSKTINATHAVFEELGAGNYKAATIIEAAADITAGTCRNHLSTLVSRGIIDNPKWGVYRYPAQGGK